LDFIVFFSFFGRLWVDKRTDGWFFQRSHSSTAPAGAQEKWENKLHARVLLKSGDPVAFFDFVL